ncbi:hypothetical protein Tco_1490130, partial [Tanacetum coccineum]
MASSYKREAIYADRRSRRDVSVLQRQRIDDGDRLTMHIQHEHDRHRELASTRDAECYDGPADAGSSSNRNSRNGDESHESRSGRRRTVPTTRECTYNDFLKCQPLKFKGTNGVVGLTQWFEKIESVFHISNYTVACQIKFDTCTLLSSALTWYNSHVKTVGHDAAYGMPWKTLKKMITAKYCPRSEIKKMFPEESDEVEKYVGGLPDMIQGLTLLGLVRRGNMVDLYLCAKNETTITMDSMLPSETTAGKLAIWPMIVEGHYKKDYPKLKNKNRGNQAGNGKAQARAYVVGNAG